jgi:hypothetical protein
MHEVQWQSFYQGELQSVYALLVVPIAFLAFRLVASPDASRAVVPDAARFVALFTIVFAIETIIDPIATGPLIKKTALKDTAATSLIPFLFVYLGDLRVLLLAVGVARQGRGLSQNLRWAAGMTLLIPVFAGTGFALARWISPQAHGQILWMLYEFGFLGLCIGLGRHWAPSSFSDQPATVAFLQSLFGYSAAYYALWLGADLLIVVGGLDLGWALRIVPNQLYYAFWIVFVYWRFFSSVGSKADR